MMVVVVDARRETWKDVDLGYSPAALSLFHLTLWCLPLGILVWIVAVLVSKLLDYIYDRARKAVRRNT